MIKVWMLVSDVFLLKGIKVPEAFLLIVDYRLLNNVVDACSVFLIVKVKIVAAAVWRPRNDERQVGQSN